MRVPQGAVWQEIRALCLDAIPIGSRLNWTSPGTLRDWQGAGYYTVAPTPNGDFDLVASTHDFGATLLTETEYFLDAAAEQQATLWRLINTAEWVSPAWTAVTLYYWAFYLASAITRSVGRCTWYMTGSLVRQLRTLGGGGGTTAGAGTYKIEVGSPVSVTDREIRVRRASRRLHEETWSLLWRLCNDSLLSVPPVSRDPLEDRLYTAFSRIEGKLGHSWPSHFRNLVNYRPKYAYVAVRRAGGIPSFRRFRLPSSYTPEEYIARLEDSVARLAPFGSVEDAPQAVAEVLVMVAIGLHAIALDLHDEVLDRHGLDLRWRAARRMFVRQHVTVADAVWPS